ncbi:FAD-dependent monooxygenase [Gammaproteobacteria bacterium]|nr:FAD-dependent monooxygenase [Gammaproteobacteria bacterium]MDB3976101.1 FAD-dependent monooxygenase [Gammaproteobacteria bacterium]MDC0569867.1 FAD-dependent monooxygenase [Gammaproteobacteria bacterium]MDC0577742.1 FAD-dependent monooxygenase [Gammaproteobacteria bacterium]MDC0590533.1 FAD-dependent monooxygenase [Gammaproteobacteria bacterium]
MEEVDVAIIGGGPGGATLANILASRGVSTVLVERQKDFSKEFRGEGLMPSGNEVLEQIGFNLDDVDYRKVEEINLFYKGELEANPEIDFLKRGELRWVSQPQLLEKLIEKASSFDNFIFYRGYKAQDLIYSEDRVDGVLITDGNDEVSIKAKVVIGFDGRTSMVRRKLKFEVKEYKLQPDVLWFKIPYPKKFLPGSQAFFSLFPKSFLVAVPVYDEKLQVGWIIPAGSYGELRKKGQEKWIQYIKEKSPKGFADHLQKCLDEKLISDPFILKMTLDRVKKWHKKGALLLGDAAHTMNAVGGQGLNIALRDAVVCANHLIPLMNGNPSTASLDNAFDAIEKERISEVRQVQEIQSRPPKFITLSEFSVQLIVPILRFVFRFNFMNNLREATIARMSRGFSEVKLKI